MQTAEKLTPTFLFKLAVLSVLLFFGVLMKPAKVTQPTAKGNMSDYIVPVNTKDYNSTLKDTLRAELPYHKLVRYRLANASSI